MIALEDWIGREEVREDRADAAPIRRLAALLDHVHPPWASGEVPPLGHWLYFAPEVPSSQIGEDGHPARGGFLPPIPLPRRMWAGGRVEFMAPAPLGVPLLRRSKILSVQRKAGRSGEMVFLVLQHEIEAEGLRVIREEQDLVYRQAPTPSAGGDGARADPAPRVGRAVAPDPVALFRYSALTFNGHRIHYDLAYATRVEGYPGLVVQGPYTATLLMDAFLRKHPGARVKRFSFRASRPLFAGRAMTLAVEGAADHAKLTAFDSFGAAAMTAEVFA